MKIRSSSISSVTFLALLLACFGQPVSAQKSALLVGVSTRETPSNPDFVEQRNQTFLIGSDGRTAELVATLPDIIAPHGHGFWRVGVATTCNMSTTQEASSEKDTGAERESDDSSWGETVYVSPIEVSPKVSASHQPPNQPCDPNGPEGVRNFAPKMMNGTPCDFDTETISFVSSQFVSVDYHEGKSEECEPRGFAWYGSTHVLRWGGTEPVSFKELTGNVGWEAYNATVRESSYNLQEDGANCETFSEHSEVVEDTNWTLHRKNGKWIAALSWQIDSGACEYGGDIDLVLPKTLTDYDTLRPSWSLLANQIKNLNDAFTSPAGNLLLARTDSSVAVYAMNAGRVRQKLLELPAGRIVMVQWATGKYVDVWTKQLSEWEKKGLPPQIFQPEQSPRP
jgi:hypothetical protein